jgi:hypothetical protein
MAFKDLIRSLLKKEPARRPLEYVKASLGESPSTEMPAPETPSPQPILPSAEAHRENNIAFSPQGDLEDYVRELSVSQEAIERWISAGVLLPEETKVAAKMIRIMAGKNKPASG